jgi:hypothetical protein
VDLGHPSVTRSLTRGLKRIGNTYSLNPVSLRNVGRLCIVLSSIPALRQATEFRRNGRIRLLLAGPNLVVRSNEHGGILASPEIDACLVPSKWVATAYAEDAPALAGRIRVWYAGVDEAYWAPQGLREERRHALIYSKNVDDAIVRLAESALGRAGWSITRVAYGSYSKCKFRAALRESRFAVFLSPTESQGIALAEAWSMDVPTLVWQPRELVIGNKRYSEFSSGPYLNPETGALWTTGEELGRLLAHLPVLLSQFSPRAWIQRNMTDVHAARKLREIVDELLQASMPSTTPLVC